MLLSIKPKARRTRANSANSAGRMAEVLRMTTLAPDIIEAVLEGRQPRQLDLQRLRGRTAPLPREWSEQRRLFGFTI